MKSLIVFLLLISSPVLAEDLSRDAAGRTPSQQLMEPGETQQQLQQEERLDAIENRIQTDETLHRMEESDRRLREIDQRLEDEQRNQDAQRIQQLENQRLQDQQD